MMVFLSFVLHIIYSIILGMKKKIKIIWPWDLPETLEGIFVVADVYMATTGIAYFLSQGVGELLIVNKDSVREVKSQYKNALVIGESPDLPDDFFDADNYPWEILGVEVKDRTVIYMTNNGTNTLERVFRMGAKEVTSVSFSNFSRVGEWLCSKNDQVINLIPAGDGTIPGRKAFEDLACLESLRDFLYKKEVDWKDLFKKVDEYVREKYSSKDFDTDLKMILDRDSLPVLPVFKKEREGLIRVSKI